MELCSKGYVTNGEAEELIGLWQNLPDVDKGPVAYPSRYKDVQGKGRFKKTYAGGSVAQPWLESMKRCMVGTGSRLAMWPNASRLVEAVFRELLIRHPGSRTMAGVLLSQWSLVLRDYNDIRNKKRMEAEERNTLMAGISQLPAPAEAGEPLPPARELQRPEPAPSRSAVFHNLAPLMLNHMEQPTVGPSLVTATAPSSSAPSSSDPATYTLRSTAWSRDCSSCTRQRPRQATLKTRALTSNSCSRCGRRRIKETGHRVLRKPSSGERVYYCPVEAKGLDPEEGLATL